jgi:GrpB-like predicted nucleotidyltransferase (UPF0157 family)
MSGRVVRVVPYDPAWPEQFRLLRDRIWPSVRDVASAFEHVGSTSVPGQAAKPVIDMDIVIPSAAGLPAVLQRLKVLGYDHLGDLGIAGREAFRADNDRPSHNLYVCFRDSAALRNHLVLRDHLRRNPADVAAYSRLKIGLAQRFSREMTRYVESKSDFILSILKQYAEFSTDELEAIRRGNQADSG